ncbi:hypothetical protein BGX28_003381 [Mortierella sp. GBA30]|nr:hypothetical protein BGX28_003381 [Mortierella sp. GBA30]
MGKSHKTRVDEDFHSLQLETEAKRVALEKLHEASQGYLKAISKRIEGDDKHKGLAIETFGLCMSAQSYTLREGSAYREALLQMGDAHQNIGSAQSDLINRFGSTYIECLERAQAQMKEYQALQKKLHSRRLDYDAKLAKVQKAKKEKPEWEEEMQAAKAKYEDTRESLLQVMTTINECQDDNVNSLKAYYDAQLAFARRMVEVLEAIPESTFVVSSSGSNESFNAEQRRRTCRESYYEQDGEHSSHSDDHSSGHSIPSRPHVDRAPSALELRHLPSNKQRDPHFLQHAAHTRKNSMGIFRTDRVSPQATQPPPQLPARGRKQVKALYNFDATGEGELSLRKGDIVRIIEEIDEGWWEGELVDPNGVRHEGMFPSNYVEVVAQDADPPPQQRHDASPKSSSPEPVRYMDEDEAAYYERESEPTSQYSSTVQDDNGPEPVAQIPVVKRAPPPPSRQAHVVPMSPVGTQPPAASALARTTSPPSRPPSAINKPVGTRAPPPPPARRTAADANRQSAVFSHIPVGSPPGAAQANESSPPGNGSQGIGYIPKDYFASHAATLAAADVGSCRECNCTEFTANVFKRGSCNNCFHAH